MTSPASRPWWKKKRWWAAGVVTLTMAYPASLGPTEYVCIRGWGVSSKVMNAVYYPLYNRPGEPPSWPMTWLYAYDEWWANLAFEHRRRAAAGEDYPRGRDGE